MKTQLSFWLFRMVTSVSLIALWSAPLRGTTDAMADEAAAVDTDAKQQGDTAMVQKLSTRFAGLTDSAENTQALVNGLHDGTAIQLTPAGSTTPVTIQPATGKMGYGNVFLALALAQQELTANGITQPTPEQLQAALNGGSFTIPSGDTTKTIQLDGVLALRAQGLGWGQIAHKLDVRLGQVVGNAAAGGLARGHEGKPDLPALGRAEKPETPRGLMNRPERPFSRPEPVGRIQTPVRPERPFIRGRG